MKMLKLSTKSRYGVRFLLDLVRHPGVSSLREVSEREGISEKYLWSLVQPLKSAGMLLTARGASGGYALAKPADSITLREVIDVLDGGIRLADCTGSDPCQRQDQCVMASVWARIEAEMEQILEQHSIASIAREEAGSGGYCI